MASDVKQEQATGVAGFVRTFVCAATSPSVPGTIGALLTTTLLFTGALMLLTPEFMARVDPGMVMLDQHDQYGYLTVRAFELREKAPAVSTAVIIGASSTQHSIPDERVLSQMLTEKLGRDARVYNMTAGGTSPWEAAALIDFLDDEITGVYVIGVGIGKFALPVSNLEFLASYPRFGFVSPALEVELHAAGFDAPRRTGVYALDNFKFFLARLKSLRHVVTGPAVFERYSTRRQEVSEERWPEHIQEWLPYLEVYEENKRPIYETLARTIERVRAGGSEVVLLNGLVNPRMREHIPAQLHAQYEQDIHEFCTRHNVAFWDLSPEMDLSPDEFFDRVHVKNVQTRTRFGALLTDRLAEYFAAQRAQRSDVQ